MSGLRSLISEKTCSAWSGEQISFLRRSRSCGGQACHQMLEMDHLAVHAVLRMEENAMQIAVSEAKARLTDLVRRAEAGEEIVLTRHGHAVVRLVAMRAKTSSKSRAELIDAVRAQAAAKATAGATAARSQDFLYDDKGLPK